MLVFINRTIKAALCVPKRGPWVSAGLGCGHSRPFQIRFLLAQLAQPENFNEKAFFRFFLGFTRFGKMSVDTSQSATQEGTWVEDSQLPPPSQ